MVVLGSVLTTSCAAGTLSVTTCRPGEPSTNQGWTGNCYECLRFCEGQRAWPIATCGPSKSTKKR
jgi:hypothetical protein